MLTACRHFSTTPLTPPVPEQTVDNHNHYIAPQQPRGKSQVGSLTVHLILHTPACLPMCVAHVPTALLSPETRLGKVPPVSSPGLPPLTKLLWLLAASSSISPTSIDLKSADAEVVSIVIALFAQEPRVAQKYDASKILKSSSRRWPGLHDDAPCSTTLRQPSRWPSESKMRVAMRPGIMANHAPFHSQATPQSNSYTRSSSNASFTPPPSPNRHLTRRSE
jgi:hypothetical protein